MLTGWKVRENKEEGTKITREVYQYTQNLVEKNMDKIEKAS